ncbi:MAG: hypothetical protein MJZ34_15840 [Paludibacteraceae bacterium]|nr:hypothetical protein [Paludibacteraceae bacterium]
MELKEAIGIIEYVRENEREFIEENLFCEMKNLLVEILYELKTLNTKNNDLCDKEDDLPF